MALYRVVLQLRKQNARLCSQLSLELNSTSTSWEQTMVPALAVVGHLSSSVATIRQVWACLLAATSQATGGGSVKPHRAGRGRWHFQRSAIHEIPERKQWGEWSILPSEKSLKCIMGWRKNVHLIVEIYSWSLGWEGDTRWSWKWGSKRFDILFKIFKINVTKFQQWSVLHNGYYVVAILLSPLLLKYQSNVCGGCSIDMMFSHNEQHLVGFKE